jgi:hypothetical protein
MLDNKEYQMEHSPTSQRKFFSCKRDLNTKRRLVIDLSIESDDEYTAIGTEKHGKQVALLGVSQKKQKSSTPSVQASEGQKIGKIIKTEKD